MARKKTRKAPLKPKSLKGLKGGLRKHWAKKGVK